VRAGVQPSITDGRFLTPRNIFNLTIQTVSVAIMATGMVFVIVTRHIDLSVGSLLATCSAIMAMTQTVVVPQWLGLGLGIRLIAPDHHPVGLARRAIDRRLPRLADRLSDDPRLHRHAGRLLVWRNVAWFLTNGQTIGPLDENFQLFGGINGTLGETGGAGSSALIAAVIGARFAAAARAAQDRPRVPGQAALGRMTWAHHRRRSWASSRS
jgi:D-xylose transport system permease protein